MAKYVFGEGLLSRIAELKIFRADTGAPYTGLTDSDFGPNDAAWERTGSGATAPFQVVPMTPGSYVQYGFVEKSALNATQGVYEMGIPNDITAASGESTSLTGRVYLYNPLLNPPMAPVALEWEVNKQNLRMTTLNATVLS